MLFSKSLQTILKKLQESGFEAFIVGGAVRDIIMGKVPSDFDIATSALPFDLLEVFKEEKVIETGLKHGTLTVILDGEGFEITSFRTDGEYGDFRHPERVSFGVSLEEDLSRRDFTINALAMNENGDIIDPFFGVKDIENKIIRAVGNPDKRFSEDALRILRAVRFSATLGFSIEEETAAALLENKGLLKNISSERKTEEFIKTLSGEYISGLPKEAISVLGLSRETLEKISRLPKIKPLLLAAAAEENPSILERLVLSRKIKQEALKILNTPSPKEVNEISLKKLYLECGELGKSVLLLKNKEAVVLCEKIEKEKAFINKEDLDFSGEEMQRLGVFGKEIAKVRDKILNGIITGELQNCKEEIEKYILEKGLDRSRK